MTSHESLETHSGQPDLTVTIVTYYTLKLAEGMFCFFNFDLYAQKNGLYAFKKCTVVCPVALPLKLQNYQLHIHQVYFQIAHHPKAPLHLPLKSVFLWSDTFTPGSHVSQVFTSRPDHYQVTLLCWTTNVLHWLTKSSSSHLCPR